MQPSQANLARCIKRIAQKDQAAFVELYQATSAKLYGIVLRIARQKELSEEILQDTYLKVWQRAQVFNQEVASPITWLAVIARHCAIDAIRKKSLPGMPDDHVAADVPDHRPGPVQDADTTMQLRRLTKCLEGLDSERQDAIKLAYLDGYTRKELAERFSQPVGSIKSWLYRGLNQLRECLDS